MDKYVDKAILFVLCTVVYAQLQLQLYSVVPLICVIIISASMSYLEDGLAALCIGLAYFAIAVLYPVFLYFLPVVFYDLFRTRSRFAAVFAIIPFGIGMHDLSITADVFIIFFAGLSWLLKKRTLALEKFQDDYIALRDSAKEFSMILEGKNKELIEKQDNEVNLATLNERNRIARDIHDTVGHLLTNAILQTGALLAVCRDEHLKAQLTVLKETLTTGMDSIRSSVHDLHDESIDLYAELKRLTDTFEFCEIILDYDLESSPALQLKYAIIAVVKESLANIIRHSDANRVVVTLREHPALFQLIVRDNGTKKEIHNDGIGHRNIAQRIEGIGGFVNIGYNDGFTVFISVPKAASGGM